LGVSVTVEDPPSLESRLLEHLVLDLSVDVPCRCLDVEGISVSATFGAHHHLTRLVLEALELSGVLLELEMPKLLLLLTLGIGVEDL
jgi:hypothetical protein